MANNPLLCHLQTVQWQDIVDQASGPHMYIKILDANSSLCKEHQALADWLMGLNNGWILN